MRKLLTGLCLFVNVAAIADIPGAVFSGIFLSSGSVNHMVVGPDGNVWFTDRRNGAVGKLMISGSNATTTLYPVGPLLQNGERINFLEGITVGPDNALWFTYNTCTGGCATVATGGLGRITTAGAMTLMPLDSARDAAQSIVTGPDGNLWFLGMTNVARVTPAGAVTRFTPPSGKCCFGSIVVGPDRNLWFSENSGVGTITTAGAITEYLGAGQGGPLVAGPDGNLWFVAAKNQLARITPSGSVTVFTLPEDAYPGGLVAAPDGNIWFSEHFDGRAGRLVVSTATSDGKASVDIAQFSSFAKGGDILVLPNPASPSASAVEIHLLENTSDLSSTLGSLEIITVGLTAVCADIVVNIPVPNSVNVGSDVSIQTTETGADSPHYSIGSGSLPPGLSIDPNTGVISGKPTAAGTYTFGVSVSDTKHPECPAVTKTVTITVNASTTSCNLAATIDSPIAVKQGQWIFGGIKVSGGTAPYTFTSTLPAPMGVATDHIAGLVTLAPGTYNYTVTVTDSSNPACSVTVPVSLVVSSNPTNLNAYKIHTVTDGPNGQKTITYTIAVVNLGSFPYVGTISADDDVPSTVGNLQPQGSCTVTGQHVNCPAKSVTLQPGDIAILGKFSGTFTPVAGQALSNYALVTAAGAAGQLATDTDTLLPGGPDLTVTKTHSSDTTPLEWTIEVRNSGSADTSGKITIIDTLPAGAALSGGAFQLGADNPNWSCTVGGPTFSCDAVGRQLLPIHPGNSIKLRVRVGSMPAGDAANTAYVFGGGSQNVVYVRDSVTVKAPVPVQTPPPNPTGGKK